MLALKLYLAEISTLNWTVNIVKGYFLKLKFYIFDTYNKHFPLIFHPKFRNKENYWADQNQTQAINLIQLTQSHSELMTDVNCRILFQANSWWYFLLSKIENHFKLWSHPNKQYKISEKIADNFTIVRKTEYQNLHIKWKLQTFCIHFPTLFFVGKQHFRILAFIGLWWTCMKYQTLTRAINGR